MEVPGQHRNGRNNQDNHQRQPPVEQQHRSEGAQHIEHGPEDIRQVPGNHAGDAVGVAHHAGENIAHRRDIVEGEGKRLQVGKEVAPQIPAHAHFNGHGVPGKQHHRQGLEQNHHQVEEAVGHNARQGASLDKVPDGVALQQRQRHIHRRTQGVEGEHSREAEPVGPQRRTQPLPDRKVKGFGIILFIKCRHAPSPPLPFVCGHRCSFEFHRYPGRCRGERSAGCGCPGLPACRPVGPGFGRRASRSSPGGK